MSATEVTGTEEALFGVTESIGGRYWTLRQADERQAGALRQQFGLPDIVARILAARGFTTETANDFLNPTLRRQMPDPARFRDMDKAVQRVAAAIQANENVAVFGDYDVDGATSSALIARYFSALGLKPLLYIPDRKLEGYGPNIPAFEKLKGQGANLVITVDCGVTAFAPLQAAHDMGVEVIVLDHHVAEPALPIAVAVVNPNRLDEEPGYGQLAACGVTYLFLVGLNRALREAGYFANRAEPDLLKLLDLVALGTVADVVPLTGLNRVFVAQGLKVLAQRQNIGMTALADVAGLREKPEAWHFGFFLGPRVNAGGRVGQADLGVRLLTSDDKSEAAAMADQLNHYNEERRAIETLILEDAMQKAEAQADAPFILVACENWHIGVIGIVAGRLKERFNKPCFVVAFENGVGKGSGRSVKGFDIGAATIAARQAGLLLNGGGHVMAAGLTVTQDKIEELRTFFTARALSQLGPTPRSEMTCDAVLSLSGATPELIGNLERLAPFGNGNYEPRIVFANVRVGFADIVGTDHVRCSFTSREGATLKAIAFRAAETPMGQALLHHEGRFFHVAGTLRLDSWQGRTSPKLTIDDIALAQ